MSGELTTTQGKSMSVDEIKGQVQIIQEVMKSVMKKDEHYGVIPGCGDKAVLLKPGAEKLCMTFRLRPIIDPAKDIEVIDHIGDHREYRVIFHILNTSGLEIATGIGCCSTKESKYRYRTENTGQEVPKEYWETRDSDIIGGKTYSAKKSQGKWYICQRVEYDNPADYYNTCLKIAKKRALVDGTLSSTAASDMFTQDIEDMAEVLETEDKPNAKPDVEPPTQKKDNGDVISEPQRKRLYAIAMGAGMTKENFKEWLLFNYEIESSSDIKRSDYDQICKDAEEWK